MTPTDTEILRLLANGLIVKEIAEKVGKTTYAVTRRIELMKKKNGARSTVQLVAKMVAMNLL
jgi:DNA-binding NarL/FixJ family response regulator